MITVVDLRKSYGSTEALRGVSFEVAEGEVFGLLGPNGAGKTTTVEILEGIATETVGTRPCSATTRSRTPEGSARADRRRPPALGAQPEPDGPRDAHRDVRGLHQAARRRGHRAVGLSEKGDARVKSQGRSAARPRCRARRRSDLVFLDEPTTGFDPPRAEPRDLIRALRSLGTTILLTTHYLDEAQQLADRVAVLRNGEIVRQRASRGAHRGLRPHGDRYRRDGELVVVETRDPTRPQRVDHGGALGRTPPRHLEVRRPTLEDVYPRARGRGAGERGVTTLVHQLRFEQKVFWRSREAAVFIFVFPLLLYALLGSVYGNEIDGIPAEDVLLVGLFGYGAATTAFGGLAITLVIRREAAR